MGSYLSKGRANGGGTSGSVSGGSIQYMAELNSYEAACRLDPEIQSYDAHLQQRTSRVISNLAANVQLHSISFETLREVTGSLFEMNQDVVRIILDCKRDIWKDSELFGLVEDYFENSLHTLDFCTVLEKCLKKARDSQVIVQLALKNFDEEVRSSEESGKAGYAKTLEELRLFKAAGSPFSDEFYQAFRAVNTQQLSMLEKLHRRRDKVEKKIKAARTWRKVTCVIFASAFAGLLICAVVAALVAAPPIAAALAASTSVPLGSMGKWFDSMWKDYQEALKAEKDLINTMHTGTFVVISDLDSIRIFVSRFEDQIRSLIENAEFAIRDEEALKFGIDEIRKKMGVFLKSIEDLVQQADRCSREIRRARTVVLQRIIKLSK